MRNYVYFRQDQSWLNKPFLKCANRPSLSSLSLSLCIYVNCILTLVSWYLRQNQTRMLLNRATNKLSVCHLSTNSRAEKYSEKIYSSVVFKNLYLKLKVFYRKFIYPWKPRLPIVKFLCFSGVKRFSHFPGALPKAKKKRKKRGGKSSGLHRCLWINLGLKCSRTCWLTQMCSFAGTSRW